MKTYEIRKSTTVKNRWYVYIDGKMHTFFSTKRAAKASIEIEKIRDNGELWNPLHPRWGELMTKF